MRLLRSEAILALLCSLSGARSSNLGVGQVALEGIVFDVRPTLNYPGRQVKQLRKQA